MKIRVSILTRIALFFLAALLIAYSATIYFSYNFMLNRATSQVKEIAKAASTAALAAIGSEGKLDDLYEDESLRLELHETFRNICQKMFIRYLYLYTVDGDGYRHYVVCAAMNDSDDRMLQTDFGFGAVSKKPLYQAEMDVLDRSVNEGYEFTDNEYGWVFMYTVPCLDNNNQVAALIGADYEMEDIITIAMENMRYMLFIEVMITTIACVISLVLIRRSVIRPMLALSERMRNFVKNKKEHIDTASRKTLYEDEMSGIENAFDSMTKDITQYVSEIETLSSEQAYNQAQLDVARRIQSGIVPGTSSRTGDNFEAFGCVRPAKEVGGDFYDIFHADDRHICVVVGDISGKGITAALFMVMVKTAIRDGLTMGHNLADTLNKVNRDICASNPENMFATVFALKLQTDTGIVTFANAGHEQPLILGRNPRYLEVESGVALGLFDDSDIVEQRFVLRDGNGILLYTDGIPEAINADKKPFGKDRLRDEVLREYLEDAQSYNAELLVNGTVASVLAHAGNAEQFDDITCLALVYKDQDRNDMILPTSLEAFEDIKCTILSSLGDSDYTRSVVLACEEIFANIVYYSGADQIAFDWKYGEDVCVATFVDNGIEFDPVSVESEIGEFEGLDRGGMGITLARINSKDMIYSRMDDQNILVMVFDTHPQA